MTVRCSVFSQLLPSLHHLPLLLPLPQEGACLPEQQALKGHKWRHKKIISAFNTFIPLLHSSASHLHLLLLLAHLLLPILLPSSHLHLLLLRTYCYSLLTYCYPFHKPPPPIATPYLLLLFAHLLLPIPQATSTYCYSILIATLCVITYCYPFHKPPPPIATLCSPIVTHSTSHLHLLLLHTYCYSLLTYCYPFHTLPPPIATPYSPTLYSPLLLPQVTSPYC